MLTATIFRLVITYHSSLDRLERIAHDDRGELSSQQVIWIAALAALAIAVAAIITNLVTQKASSINLG